MSRDGGAAPTHAPHTTAADAAHAVADADAVVGILAERLADPGRTCDPEEMTERPPTGYSALNGGVGLALLYAELGRDDPQFRPIAHRYLALAGRELTGAQRHCLYEGAPALAFAAVSAMQHPGEYAKLLGDLDASVHRSVRRRLDQERARLRAGAVAKHYLRHDVIAGLTGLGRYLLRRCPGSAEAESLLREILAYVGELTRPVEREGESMPGWWVEDFSPYASAESVGHANLGMAHGIPGPLALLASAWRAGVRVPGQEEAIGAIAEFLVEWSDEDDGGPYWPRSLDLAQYLNRPSRLPRERMAWCYGTPGVARALQLAGLALERTGWTDVAREAAQGVFRRPEAEWGFADTCLCHGSAGLLHIVGRINVDDPRCRLEGDIDRLAQRVVDAFDTDARFGYRQFHTRKLADHDDPGFLTGSAGVALALHAYRNGPRPASGWDSVLLLA